MTSLSTLAKTVRRRTVKGVLFVGLPLGVLYLPLAWVGLLPAPNDCLTETRATIHGLGGYDFDVSETNCDRIAKDDWFSVFVSRSGTKKKFLLFEYEPGGPQNLVPTITVPDPQTIHIAIPWVASILSHQERWNGVSIVYKIDRIDFPDVKQKDEH